MRLPHKNCGTAGASQLIKWLPGAQLGIVGGVNIVVVDFLGGPPHVAFGAMAAWLWA